MTSKQTKQVKQQRPKSFVTAAISPDLWDEFPVSIRSEMKMYAEHLRLDPMMEYGDIARLTLSQHVERRATAFVSIGSKCLHLEPVVYLLDKAFTHKSVTLHVGTSFNGAVREVVAAGIAHTLTALFITLEIGVKNLSNTALLRYGLNESQAETFRGLASGYAGTFDELLETARNL